MFLGHTVLNCDIHEIYFQNLEPLPNSSTISKRKQYRSEILIQDTPSTKAPQRKTNKGPSALV